ncbi:ribosome small subunit-dependent GTPase A [Collinsella vaginalis]|uniref:ribosome small subunit-dependent GTPase A n=1 Tax=Collinsella vaginalis TaxID=1870987 RepID=UPI001FE61209|nr:ribosome small subunit-dependent GTPase A [Collinsella vaginalis]
MGKGKGGKGSRSARRHRTSAADATAFELPAIGLMSDLPAFSDLRVDDTQTAAFTDFRSQFDQASGGQAASHLQIGGVIRLDRGFPLVATPDVTLRSEHAVAFAKRGADEEPLLPAIGDIVAVRVDPGHDKGVIEAVLPRRTAFERWRGKSRGECQVLAANVDVILIVQPLGSSRDSESLVRDRIARSLVLVNDCGAVPVVVFTKADRSDPAARDRAIRDACALAGEGVRVIVTSSRDGLGLDEVRACVPAGACGMILGESGAGKSTLLNALLGHDALATGAVRERDDMGRHTTVARVMCKLPGPHGVIADAPGLRSLPLVGHELGLARTFPDVARASRGCRFSDCTHTHEPGCAVRGAVDAGEIDAVRVEAFLALAREMRVSAQSLDPDVRL